MSLERAGLHDEGVRSVYLPVIRSGLYPVFQAFDFADPSMLVGPPGADDRAPQALFILNDGLVLRGVDRAWPRRLLARSDLDDAGRVPPAVRHGLRPAADGRRDRPRSWLSWADSRRVLAGRGVPSTEAQRRGLAGPGARRCSPPTSSLPSIDRFLPWTDHPHRTRTKRPPP